MSRFLRIVIAAPDEASRALISRLAGQYQNARVVAEADDAPELMNVVAYRRPHLVFVSTELDDMRGFEVADRLSRQHPGLYVAMTSPRRNVEDVRRAMKAGAREYLAEPLSEDDVRRVIDDAGDFAGSAPDRKGVLIAVMSSKGGVGKSTLSVDLSIALKQAGVGRIALVDGDLYFGDVATMLDIRPERTIHDLNGALDAEIADRFLTHHSSGIEVLAAPRLSEQAEEISPDRFRTILGVLQGLYNYIVVDVTAAALDTMLPTLDVADFVLMLSTLDVVCLKDVSQVLDMIQKLRFPIHNIMLVGNRFDERYSLNPRDAEKTLNMKFTAVLPRDDRVTVAANRGVPMTLSEPGAPFTRQVVTLAKTITARVGRLNHVSA